MRNMLFQLYVHFLFFILSLSPPTSFVLLVSSSHSLSLSFSPPLLLYTLLNCVFLCRIIIGRYTQEPETFTYNANSNCTLITHHPLGNGSGIFARKNFSFEFLHMEKLCKVLCVHLQYTGLTISFFFFYHTATYGMIYFGEETENSDEH